MQFLERDIILRFTGSAVHAGVPVLYVLSRSLDIHPENVQRPGRDDLPVRQHKPIPLRLVDCGLLILQVRIYTKKLCSRNVWCKFIRSSFIDVYGKRLSCHE